MAASAARPGDLPMDQSPVVSSPGRFTEPPSGDFLPPAWGKSPSGVARRVRWAPQRASRFPALGRGHDAPL